MIFNPAASTGGGEVGSYVIGTYTGNGSVQTIDLGFKPRLVFVIAQDASKTPCVLMAIDGYPLKDDFMDSIYDVLWITENGFRVDNGYGSAAGYRVVNYSGTVYLYAAFA